MRIVELPLGPSLDLTTRASLIWWNAAPRRHRQYEAEDFWRRMPGLTVPQEAALRLGRTPDQVSIQVVKMLFDRRAARMHESRWTTHRLRHYVTIWRRTHAATLFRLTGKRPTSQLGATNPLRPVLGWAEPDDVLEDRFLMAGLHHGQSYRHRRELVRRTLRVAKRQGYVSDLQVCVP